MAMQSPSSYSTSFGTKEGTYRKGNFQYCRETRKAHSGKELAPVSVSFVSCKDKEGLSEWITFNSAKEFYFYPFYGMRKVSFMRLQFLSPEKWGRILIRAHYLCYNNGVCHIDACIYLVPREPHESS